MRFKHVVFQKVWYVDVGVDPTANQDNDQPASDRETFQLEFDVKAEQWRVRTADDQYWNVEAATGIQASSTGQYELNHSIAVHWKKNDQLPFCVNGKLPKYKHIFYVIANIFIATFSILIVPFIYFTSSTRFRNFTLSILPITEFHHFDSFGLCLSV